MLALGCDHGGYELKQEIKKYLDEKGIAYKDFGCDSTEAVDYPVYAKKVAKSILSGECEKGTVDKITACLHNYKLPATTAIDMKTLAKGAFNDKKRHGKDIKLVIPQRIGSCTVKQLPTDKLCQYLGGEE